MTVFKLPVPFALCLLVLAVPARADTIPYAAIGTELSIGSDIYATGGPVKAYFYASDAWFYSVLYLDLPTAVGPALHNTSTPGQVFDFGTYAAGTPLRFRLHVDQRDGTFRNLYSGTGPAPDGDTEIHTYVTPWTGGVIPGSNVSISGNALFIGWEDIHGSTSDWDYNDHQFVLMNASTHTTPEPGTLALIGGAGVMIGLLHWRKRA